MKKICMLIPYFGNFPKWFDLYLYSCSRISQIDFYYFTDCTLPIKKYDNTFFIKTSFTNYCELVSKKLKVNFNPTEPYILVNIKPFLGTIHNNIARKYEFWGYSDIDLIYGDMSKILNNYNLNKYDLITTHSERVAGHFTIIRTNSKYNNLAFKIKNWPQKINRDHDFIDEGDFSNLVFPYFRNLRRLWKYIFSKILPNRDMYYFYQKVHNFMDNNILFWECYTTPIPKNHEYWSYDLKKSSIKAPVRFRGKKYLNGDSLIYLHFLFFKKTRYRKTNIYWKDNFYQIPDNYDFSKGGIVKITNKGIRLEKI